MAIFFAFLFAAVFAKLVQEPLPYAFDALAPIISEKAMRLHYEKHHFAYVNNVNNLLSERGEETFNGKAFEDLLRASAPGVLYNNLAQTYNHDFFFASMRPGGGGEPRDSALSSALARDFGSFAEWRKEFKKVASSLFGSGWVWLAVGGSGRLQIVPTKDATPVMGPGVRPLLVLDVWEHAYYPDFQNRRADFIDGFLDRLVNWERATQLFALAAEKEL